MEIWNTYDRNVTLSDSEYYDSRSYYQRVLYKEKCIGIVIERYGSILKPARTMFISNFKNELADKLSCRKGESEDIGYTECYFDNLQQMVDAYNT